MDLDGIAVFVKVVRLEKRLGVQLIQRTTRKLHGTPAGRAYFERCVRRLEKSRPRKPRPCAMAPRSSSRRA